MKHSPILIAAPTRCGTTMLAWLLHLHGVWIGKAGVTKAPQTNPQVGTENIAIKDYLKRARSNPKGFRQTIESMVPDDQPWLVKSAGNLMAKDAWLTHFPDAIWLLPTRPVQDIVKSKMNHPGMAKRGVSANQRRTIQHMNMQKDVAKQAKNAVWICADLLCRGGAGGENEARSAVEFCGLEFDPDIYHQWVQPERWHGAQTLARTNRFDLARKSQGGR